MARYELTLSPRTLTRALLVAALALLACHGVLSILHHRVQELPWLLLQLFDVDEENNLPTWYSAFLLLAASVLLWVCAQTKRAAGDPWFGHWVVLAVGFLLLSVDEVAGVHETINSIIAITWAIPAGVVVGIIGLAFIPFFRHLPRHTAVLFALAGAIYLAGAVALEVLGNSLVGRGLGETLRYKLTTLVEESLEMLGVILFLHTLLRYMRRPRAGSVNASLELS